MNSPETPGGSGIPAGWYDDPSGQGLRWWDGEAWTEHVHTAESAAAASGAGDGSREGKPPRDLVKLREAIRARGAKGVGLMLGAAVLVVVVVALLVSGGSEENAKATPGGTPPGAAKTHKGSSKKAQIKKIDKQLKNKKLSKSKRKQLEKKKKKLKKGGKSKKKKKGKKGKGAKKQGGAKKKEKTPGEEGD